MIYSRSSIALHGGTDARWIQSFAENFRGGSRDQSGNYRMSPTRENKIEIQVAAHFGAPSSLITSAFVDENDVETADKTLFVFNIYNGRTQGFCCSSDVKYADAISGREGFKTMVRLTRKRNESIANPFLKTMIVTNQSCVSLIISTDLSTGLDKAGGWIHTACSFGFLRCVLYPHFKIVLAVTYT